MFSRLSVQYCLLAAVSVAHGMILVESVDGSFLPWHLLPRAPDGSVPVRLSNNNDVAYLATVQMGTPPQQVPMAPSLSQNLIAVASPASGVDTSSYYNPTLSTTYTPSNDIATIQTVSDGSFSGHFAGETCALLSAASNFTYTASLALTDSSLTNALYPPGANGILGYGVGNPTTLPINASLVQSFLPTNFTNAVCGIELNHMDDPVSSGILTMGAVDASAFTGDFTDVLVPADSQVSWSIAYDKLSYKANGGDYDVPGLLASVDILHTGIQVPTHVAQKIYSCIPGSYPVSSTVWSIPCNSTFPVTLMFGGKPFTIPERDTIKKFSNGTCHGAITGGAHKLGQVGAPFLRNFYTRFGVNKTSDGPKAFVGFAAKKLRQK